MAGLIDRVRGAMRRARYATADRARALTDALRRIWRRAGDALVPDAIAARLGRMGGSMRRVREAAGDFARLVGSGIRSAAGAARDLWMRLSLRARQVIVAVLALAVGALIAWFAIVPVLPCQLPGGDTCPPHDDAAELVPADALAYVHTNLDPGTAQYSAAVAFAGRVPLLASELTALAPLPGGGGVEFGKQIAPWLGGEVALAVVAAERGTPAQVYLLEVSDQQGAEDFARTLLGNETSTTKRSGVEISVDSRGVATAVVAGFLVIGTEVGVERIVDTHAGTTGSLADSPSANAIADTLPGDSLVQAYLSEDGAQRLLAGNPGPLSSLDTFVNFDATVGAGAALVAAPDGLELEIHSTIDPERAKTNPGFFDAFPPFEPQITDTLAPRTMAYLGLGDPQASIEQLLAQAQSQAPGLVVGFSDFAEKLQKKGGVDVQGELLPALGGEAAFAIEPGEPPQPAEAAGKSTKSKPKQTTTAIPGLPAPAEPAPGAPPLEDVAPSSEGEVVAPAPSGIPYLSFIATDVDPDAAGDALAKLQAPIAKALSDSGAAPSFEESTVDGVTVHSAVVSPAVNLTYATIGNTLVVSTQPEGVARAAGGPGGLSGAELFGRATDGFPDAPAFELYLNLRELLDVAERAGLADVSAYLPFAQDATSLAAAALAVEHTETTLDTSARLVLGEPAG